MLPLLLPSPAKEQFCRLGMQRSRSAPVGSLRNSLGRTLLSLSNVPTLSVCGVCRGAATAYLQPVSHQLRYHSYDFDNVKNPGGADESSRDLSRIQNLADTATGEKVGMGMVKDYVPLLEFSTNTAELISIPESTSRSPRQSRYEEELRNNGEVNLKFGELGPGERLKESPTAIRRSMQEKAQDIDGLPWEVRWKKQLIPTQEEAIQDLRDRFELFEPDAIVREELWYLHWKDRGYSFQRDRLIWPQGYTDYLDHYDEHGRRRVLPSDQKWSSSSWKHLADAQYKDRMFLIDKHERRVFHETLQNERVQAEKDAAAFLEQVETQQGISAGVIDMNPDQAFEAIAGTSDPVEVAKVKKLTREYQALSAHKAIRGAPEDMDPLTGLPKSNKPPLANGMTLEEAALIATTAEIAEDELHFQSASLQSDTGKSAVVSTASKLLKVGKAKDKPMVAALVEEKIEQIDRKKAKLAALEGQRMALESVEGDALKTIAGGSSTGDDYWTAVAENDQPREGETGLIEEGFISVPKATQGKHQQISLPPDTHTNNATPDEDVPEWYRSQAIETGRMIESYGLTNDPLEMVPLQPPSSSAPTGKLAKGAKKGRANPKKRAAVSSFHDMPEHDDSGSILGDEVKQSISSFDTQKVFDATMNPESSGSKTFEPLPLFKEIAKGSTASSDVTAYGENDTTNFIKSLDSLQVTGDEGHRVGTPSDRHKDIYLSREERAANRRRTKGYDPDLLLPDLPWETDGAMDPYRGVAEKDAVPFDRKALLATWGAYRGALRQMMAEIVNFSREGSPEGVRKMISDSRERLRRGEVGDHPQVAGEIESMIRHIFEANFAYFEKEVIVTDRDSVETNRLATKADELNRQGTAKAKLLGPSYVNFVTEMASLEIDEMKRNPMRRRTIVAHQKGVDKFVSPFVKWIQRELEPFQASTFNDHEALTINKDILGKAAESVHRNAPHDASIDPALRKQVLMGAYNWSRGLLAYATGCHYTQMMRRSGEASFRSAAEDSFNWASEYFQAAYNQTNGIVTLPIPNSEPVEQYSDREFPLNENPLDFEAEGNFERADELWGVGSTKRWYGSVDETEFVLYCERRGRFQAAMDAADRTMEYMQKKTHPSIHPFPDRARLWLEDAPLTQETAEHLWLRNMGTIYLTFSELHSRQLRLQTARDLRNKGLNCLSTAVVAAKERLPITWRAPLLTKAIYMLHAFDSTTDPHLYIRDLEFLVDQMYTMKEQTRHWIHPETRQHYRVALIHANEAAYASAIHQIARQKTNQIIADETLMRALHLRAEGRSTDHIPGLAKYDEAIREAVEHVFRAKIRKYLAQETPHNETHLALTHLYFNFRVRPKQEAEIDELWKMYSIAWEAIYTQCCFGESCNGINKLDEALQYLCHISFYGNVSQKERLLGELQRVKDKLNHLVRPGEIDRCIASVEKNIGDLKAGKADRLSEAGCIYIYSLKTTLDTTAELSRIAANPVLTMSHSEEDNYKKFETLRKEKTVSS